MLKFSKKLKSNLLVGKSPQPLSHQGKPNNPYKYLKNLKVGQKIALGYGLAISVAIFGTITGFIIGDYYYYQAIKKETDALEEKNLVNKLEVNIAHTQNHWYRIVSVLENPDVLHHEYELFSEHLNQFITLWLKFASSQGLTLDGNDSSAEVKLLIDFLSKYEDVPKKYIEETTKVLNEINLQDLKSTEIPTARKRLIESVQSPIFNQLDELAHDLEELSEIYDDEYEESQQEMVGVEQLRIRIILSSLCLSIAIASLLIWLISQAISQPLQTVAQVAQQATQESNFDLKTDIDTQDEVGVVAHSFNQLLAKVKELLDEQKETNLKLEESRQNLENKVNQRTQELHTNNHNLQVTLQTLQAVQMQLVHSEKMSSLGQLVAGIAHEINNPVNFIQGNLSYTNEYAENLLKIVEIYQNHCPNLPPNVENEIAELDIEFIKEDLTKLLKSMSIGTTRIIEIVKSMRTFSRLDEAELTTADIHEGIDSTLVILDHKMSGKSGKCMIKLIKEYGNLPLVKCYHSQLNQVFMNILSNAIDTLEEASIKQANENGEKRDNIIRIHTELVDHKWVKIVISDNGMGMTEEVRSHIFDPFFTTKPVGKGTGLGLAISYQIITEKHQGELNCQAVPNKGTEFMIKLPLNPIKS